MTQPLKKKSMREIRRKLTEMSDCLKSFETKSKRQEQLLTEIQHDVDTLLVRVKNSNK